MAYRASLLAALVSLLVAACTTQQAAGVGQVLHLDQCNRIADAQERGRCLDLANRPRDAY
jgi:hypothetical protein